MKHRTFGGNDDSDGDFNMDDYYSDLVLISHTCFGRSLKHLSPSERRDVVSIAIEPSRRRYQYDQLDDDDYFFKGQHKLLRTIVQNLAQSDEMLKRYQKVITDEGTSITRTISLLDMESDTSTLLFPSHRCKTLHLVRHAQGIHNVDGEKNHEAYMSPDFFDAHLTPLGWEQVGNLRKHVHECGLTRRIDLVIVSPLLRTIQTAVGVFGGEDYVDGVDVPPLMIANAGNSEHPAISSLNCPPFLAVETCRERLGVHPCDKRRSITEYRPLFPAIDFSLIESDEDILWTAEKREAREEVAARGMRFINWLWTRKEKEIAIVTHSGFLVDTLEGFGNDCLPSVKKEISKRFTNCELRSMVLVDRSQIGLNRSTTNYRSS